MNFDIKDVKSWYNRHEVKNDDKGYFAKSISQLQNDKHVELTTVYSINDDMGTCFIPKGWGTGFDFFLPLDAVKEDKPEKKYRPLKSIDEMDCLFDCSVMSAKNFLTYRNKASGKIYIELLFSVCRDQDDILLSINNISVQNLFKYFEIRKNGEWQPFGVEVKEDE